MIDPINITKYDQSQKELEEVLLFWICAAGKNGVTAARCLENLLTTWRSKSETPFEVIRRISDLPAEMKRHGIGCYNAKAKTFLCLIDKGFDLTSCTVEDLESVPGIGPKTARCFLIHSRRNQEYAGLDTHILKFLRDNGHDVPKSTPAGKKYKELEQVFLKYAKAAKMSVADFDLRVWNKYRNGEKV